MQITQLIDQYMLTEEYKALRKATENNDLVEIRRIITELKSSGINANELEIDDFGELPSSLIALAVAKANPEILTILLAYGFDPNQEINGEHPLHVAAAKNKDEHAAILIKHGVYVDLVSAKSSSTPLYVADECGALKVKKVLLANGAKIDPNRPLDDKKISRSKLEKLLSEHPSTDLNLVDLLAKNNFSPSVKGFNIKFDKFKSLNFSGVDCSGCVLRIDQGEQIEFQGSNLTNTLIDVCNNPQVLNFNDALMDKTLFIGEERFQRALSAKQSIACDFLYLNANERFKQARLTSTYGDLDQEGVCFGLCVVYMRTDKNHDGKKPFIDKLKRKLDNESTKFIERLSFFHRHNQKLPYNPNFEFIPKTMDINANDIKNKQALAKIYAHCDVNYVHLSLTFSKEFSGHAAILHRVVNSTSTRYQIYDPNFGKSPLLTEEKANEHLCALVRYYEKAKPMQEVSLAVEDFEERYLKSIKNQPDAPKLKGF